MTVEIFAYTQLLSSGDSKWLRERHVQHLSTYCSGELSGYW